LTKALQDVFTKNKEKSQVGIYPLFLTSFFPFFLTFFFALFLGLFVFIKNLTHVACFFIRKQNKMIVIRDNQRQSSRFI